MLHDSSAASATLFRTIPGPVAEVYAAWLSPDLLRRWLAMTIIITGIYDPVWLLEIEVVAAA